MGLSYRTTLRGYLNDLHSMAREQARLYCELVTHPDSAGAVQASEVFSAVVASWETLRRDIPKVLGGDVQILLWNELAASHTFAAPGSTGWVSSSNERPANDPYRVTLRALQKKADKARLKDRSITLLKSFGRQRGPEARTVTTNLDKEGTHGT